jgi:hypothetical protein
MKPSLEQARHCRKRIGQHPDAAVHGLGEKEDDQKRGFVASQSDAEHGRGKC